MMQTTARRRFIRAVIPGAFALLSIILLVIFWPQWVHIPWWQSLLLMGFVGGWTANSKDATRALLGLE